MKAEAAECVRTAVALGLGSSELAARGATGVPGARGLPLGRGRRPSWTGCARRCARCRRDAPIETSAFAHAVLVDDPLEQLKVARALRAACAPQGAAAAAARARAHGGRLRLGYLSADFHTHATSQLLVQMLEHHDRGAFEVSLLVDRPGRRQRAAPARASPRPSTSRTCAARADAAHRAARARARHRHPGRPEGRHPRHAVAGVGAAAGAAAGQLAGFSRHHRRALHRLPDRRPGGHAAGPRGALQREDRADAACATSPTTRGANCRSRSSRADWGVPDDALLLCAFHQSYKISAEVFDVWCSTAAARCPTRCCGCCSGTPTCRTTLRAAAAARGIDAERLRVRAAAAAAAAPEPAGLRRRLSRCLAVQRPHHRRRGAVGRRAGGHAAGPRPSRSVSPSSLLHAVRA